MTVNEQQVSILTNTIAYAYNSDGIQEEVFVDEEGVKKARETAILCLERLDEERRIRALNSGLCLHAIHELNLIGEDPDNIEWFVNVILEFLSYGHSVTSAEICLDDLIKLLRGENLAPLTADPSEWIQHEPDFWQSMRNSACISKTQGRTYYNVNDSRRTIYSTERVIQPTLFSESSETQERDQFSEETI